MWTLLLLAALLHFFTFFFPSSCAPDYLPRTTHTGGLAPRRALPETICDKAQFAYLFAFRGQFPSYGDYRELAESPSCEVFISTWGAPLSGAPRRLHHRFMPGATFSVSRRNLLDMALERERRRGCRFRYYVYLDEHAPALQLKASVASLDGVNVSLAPHQAFQHLLLELNPAVGLPDYWGAPSCRVGSILLLDHILIAIHSTAARLLLPLHEELDAFHWYYSQQLFDWVANVLFVEHVHVYRVLRLGQKIPHTSGSAAGNPGRPWVPPLLQGVMQSLFRNGSVLSRRIWPWRHGVPQVAREAPATVRYDVDLSGMVRVEQPLWLWVNHYWAQHGSGSADCGGDFCDLADPRRTEAYRKEVSEVVLPAPPSNAACRGDKPRPRRPRRLRPRSPTNQSAAHTKDNGVV